METIQKYLKIIVESNYLHQRKLDLLKEQKRIITNNVYSFLYNIKRFKKIKAELEIAQGENIMKK